MTKQKEISKLKELEKSLWDELQNLTQCYGEDDPITIRKSNELFDVSMQLEELDIE